VIAGDPVAVGIDVGGTKVSALRVRADGEVLARAHGPTPADDVEATIEALLDAAGAVLTSDVVAVGLGAAGLVHWSDGTVLFAPNLAWRDAPLKARLERAFDRPAVVDNDCTAAAYGEWQIGAARGVSDVVYVGVGTGIGGGIVAGGAIQRGANGFGGEIGHIIVEPGGPECGCGNLGCWETVASGRAILRDGRAAVTRHRHSLLAELAAGDPGSVTGQMVTEAAEEGDATALGIFAEAGHRLGQGIAGIVNVLDPSVVVVGGGAAEAGDLLLEPARVAYRSSVEGRERRPDVPIVGAMLGADGAAIGAALLAIGQNA
jgi:glucokinase